MLDAVICFTSAFTVTSLSQVTTLSMTECSCRSLVYEHDFTMRSDQLGICVTMQSNAELTGSVVSMG